MNNLMIIVTAIVCSSNINGNGISAQRLGDPLALFTVVFHCFMLPAER